MNLDLITKIATGLLAFCLFLLSGIIFKRYVYKILLKWTEKTKFRADDIVLGSLRGYIVFWFALCGVYFSSPLLFSQNAITRTNQIIAILFILSVSVVLSRIVAGLIRIYAQRFQTTIAVSGLTQSISRGAILIIGFLMVLNSLGISITPILTTLGIGGLAVALALQDTLSNLFSGFHIILAKQIQIGDYIQLETGQEGYVEDINWRTTKIRMLPNNIILIPNSKFSQVIVTNFYLPKKEMTILVDVGVHYESDLEEVEKITLKVAKQVLKDVEGAVPEFEPFVRFHTFGDFSINCTVYLRAKEFFDQYRLKHEFIKRLHREFKEKSIVIPFPITALNLTQEQAHKYLGK